MSRMLLPYFWHGITKPPSNVSSTFTTMHVMFKHVLFIRRRRADGGGPTEEGLRCRRIQPISTKPDLVLISSCTLAIVLSTSVFKEDLLHECLDTADRQIVFKELHDRLLLPVLALTCV